MERCLRRLELQLSAIAMIFAIGHAGDVARGAGPSGEYVLQDYLGRNWRNECVTFPLDVADAAKIRAGRALQDANGKMARCQLVAGDNLHPNGSVAFIADLDAFQTRRFHFADTPAGGPGDLMIDETDTAIRLTNRRVGIAVARNLAHGAGPLAGIWLPSGKWIGSSKLEGAAKILGYHTEVLARGPVFAEVAGAVDFEGGRTWEIHFRLNANEPVVLVDESCPAIDGLTMTVSLSLHYSPDHLFYRYGTFLNGWPEGSIDSVTLPKGKNGQIFLLEPWLHWGAPEARKGNWFGVYNDADPTLLAIGAREPAMWVDPATPTKPGSGEPNRAAGPIPILMENGEIIARFPFRGAQRKWTIQAHDRDACLDVFKGAPVAGPRGGGAMPPKLAPLPQIYLIKHGDFPLDRVKDYVLDWKADAADHPRMFLTKAEIAAIRTSFKAEPGKLQRYRSQPLTTYGFDEPFRYYLGTGDPELGAYLARTAAQWVQDAVDVYLHQDRQVTLGFAPHHQWNQTFPALNLADVAINSDYLSPKIRARVRAQVAFLGYTFNRDDFWSPPRGNSATANMTTTVAAERLAVACLIPSHPQASAWAKEAIEELRDRELNTWSDANGGWREAPHYAMVSYDCLLGCFLMARNAGFGELIYDPKMRQIAEWFAKISTPPDAALDGHRHLPPIGNTYIREWSGEFGLLAFLWREKDPAFAAQMKWMHHEHGSFDAPGVGGLYPTLAGYRSLMNDVSVLAKAPAYGSELFPDTGLILRSGFPSPRETQLYMIAGSNHEHYDFDSGSITLWGKGRVFADDFGYVGQAPGSEHSMVVGVGAPDSGIMNVRSFSTAEYLDYVLGVKTGKDGSSSWERRIVFLKDADPLAPNYFVIRDSLIGAAPGTSRVWLTAKSVTTAPDGIVVRGTEDTDLDVFIASPKGLTPTIEELTRNSSGNNAAGVFRTGTPKNQTGIVMPVAAGDSVVMVLYPRLASERKPTFTSLDGGKVVKIQGVAGTDYVFVASAPFNFQEGDITFDGAVGAVQIRKGRVILSLGDAGTVHARGHSLMGEKASSRQWSEKN